MSDRLPLLHRLLFGLCSLTLLGMLGTRALHYASASLPPRLDDLLAAALAFELSIFANVTALVIFYQPLAVVGIVLLLVFRKRLLRRSEDRLGTHPALHSAIWISFVLGHFFFDLDPFLAGGALLSLLLAAPHLRRSADRTRAIWPRRVEAGAWIAFFAIWSALSGEPLVIAAIAIWAVLLALVTVGARRHLFARDRLLLGVAGLAVVQGVAALLPLLMPPPGATRLGSGMAYSFCEAPRHAKLFAVVPQCFTLPLAASWENCIEGHLAQFDLRDLKEQKRHHFLSERFYGRMEQLTCLEDTIQIGMSSALIDGEPLGQNAMEFEIAPPHRIRTNLVGAQMGDRLAYDAKRDALFYVGEWSNRIVRYDRAAKTASDHHADPPDGRITIMGQKVPGSLLLSRYSIHDARDTLYLVEWLGGRWVQELGLASLEVQRKFLHNNGGAIGLAVDEELERIYVTGLWGMEVFDLRSGALIARRRLGFFSRVPVLDAEHDLLYVPSTVEGKIRVFDRHDLEPLGAIAIGYGTRHPYLSFDSQRFFASSRAAYYWWDAAELARRFRGTP